MVSRTRSARSNHGLVATSGGSPALLRSVYMPCVSSFQRASKCRWATTVFLPPAVLQQQGRSAGQQQADGHDRCPDRPPVVVDDPAAEPGDAQPGQERQQDARPQVVVFQPSHGIQKGRLANSRCPTKVLAGSELGTSLDTTCGSGPPPAGEGGWPTSTPHYRQERQNRIRLAGELVRREAAATLDRNAANKFAG